MANELDIERIEYLRLKLQALLALLTIGEECDTLEYGDPLDIGGYYSYLRIRRINTHGGLQYCLRRIYPGRGESSGDYHVELLGIELAAMNAVLAYHKPSKLDELRATLKKNLPSLEYPTLDWFGYDYEKSRDNLKTLHPLDIGGTRLHPVDFYLPTPIAQLPEYPNTVKLTILKSRPGSSESIPVDYDPTNLRIEE